MEKGEASPLAAAAALPCTAAGCGGQVSSPGRPVACSAPAGHSLRMNFNSEIRSG